jgi:uncharacterized protein
VVISCNVELLDFAWNEEKAKANLAKHGVGFEEASTVFGDPLAHVGSDPEHTAEEMRMIIIGHSALGRLLLVSFAERGDVIRVISARPLTRRERRLYEETQFPKRG